MKRLHALVCGLLILAACGGSTLLPDRGSRDAPIEPWALPIAGGTVPHHPTTSAVKAPDAGRDAGKDAGHSVRPGTGLDEDGGGATAVLRIVRRVPSPGDDNVAVSVAIEAELSDEIALSSVGPNDIRVLDGTNLVVSGDIPVLRGHSIVFQPAVPLEYDTTYFVQLGDALEGLTSVHGASLSSTDPLRRWTFHTAKYSDVGWQSLHRGRFTKRLVRAASSEVPRAGATPRGRWAKTSCRREAPARCHYMERGLGRRGLLLKIFIISRRRGHR